MYLYIYVYICIYINSMCAMSLAKHLRAVADAFRPLKTFFSCVGTQTSPPIGENGVGISSFKDFCFLCGR